MKSFYLVLFLFFNDNPNEVKQITCTDTKCVKQTFQVFETEPTCYRLSWSTQWSFNKTYKSEIRKL